MNLPPALSGRRLELHTPATGRLSYYRNGPDPQRGRPLLLIHSINAAASAYEVRPLYEHYSARRPVYAPDLPGFGYSERSERPYTLRLMTDAVHALVAEIRREHPGQPVDALSLSLSAEFLARAAVEAPEAFGSVALVSPTGFDRRAPLYGEPGSSQGRPGLYRVLRFPLWDRAFFKALVSGPSIRFFLRKTWGSKDIDEGFFHYACQAAHQPGARFAPYHFVSGFLFGADISRIYESLQQPVWMVHGVRGDFVDYRYKKAVEDRPNWTVEVMETGALPHFERTTEFIDRYERFLGSTPPG